MWKKAGLVFVSILLLISAAPNLRAQDHDPEEESSTAGPPKKHHFKHSIQFMNGMTVIPKSSQEEDLLEEGLTHVPTVGFSYAYAFSHHFALRAMADVEASKYFVNTKGEALARSNVVIFALVGVFNPVGNLEVFVGPGYEIEKNESLWLARVGVEYPLYVANGWFLGPEILFDFKEKYYSWTAGLKFIKAFD